jgi:hypothetical protein
MIVSLSRCSIVLKIEIKLLIWDLRLWWKSKIEIFLFWNRRNLYYFLFIECKALSVLILTPLHRFTHFIWRNCAYNSLQIILIMLLINCQIVNFLFGLVKIFLFLKPVILIYFLLYFLLIGSEWESYIILFNLTPKIEIKVVIIWFLNKGIELEWKLCLDLRLLLRLVSLEIVITPIIIEIKVKI